MDRKLLNEKYLFQLLDILGSNFEFDLSLEPEEKSSRHHKSKSKKSKERRRIEENFVVVTV